MGKTYKDKLVTGRSPFGKRKATKTMRDRRLRRVKDKGDKYATDEWER